MRPSIARLLAATLLTGIFSSLRAAEPAVPLEERLRRLEASVQALQSENDSLRRELGTAAATLDGRKPIVPTPGGREIQLVVGGFLQGQAEFGDAADSRFVGTNDRFYFRRARMYLSGTFAEHFQFKVEGEFAANSVSAATGLRASANELYIAWTRFPAANVKFGQLKPAFGGEQLASDTKLPAVERFLGSDRLTDPRQVGLSLGGDLVPNRFSYLLAVGNGNGPNTSANDNNRFMQTARLMAVAFDRADAGRLTFGVNAMHSDDEAVTRAGFGFDSVPGGAIDNVFAGHRTGWGVDAVWHRGLLDVSSEYLRMHFAARNRVPRSSLDAAAWQLSAAYFLVPNTVQGVIRHEVFDPNTAIGGDSTENWLVGVNYLLKGDDLRLMVDYLFGHSADAPDSRGRLLTRFQIMF